MNILICDDDEIFLDFFNNELQQKIGAEHNFFSFSKTEDIDRIIKNSDPSEHFELAILDIRLQEKNGIDYAFLLEQKYPDIKTIFISGYDDYYEAMFMKVKPFAFLHKPINIDVLLFHIKSIADSLSTDNKKFSLISKKLKAEIPFNKIVFFESFKRIVVVHCTDGSFDFYGKLGDIEDSLPENFTRTHQSYIVNMNYVNDTDFENNVTLNDDTVVKISRSYKKDFQKKYFLTKGGIL